MAKFKSKYLLLLVLCLLCGWYATACCTSGYDVNISFLGLDTELKLHNNSYIVDFEEDVNYNFEIPEGYDHESLVITANNKNVEYTVEFGDSTVDTDYLYTTKKIISFTVLRIVRDTDIVIDMTNVKKRVFNITVDKELSNFVAVSVNEDSLSKLTTLDETTTYKETPVVNGKLNIVYGEHIALVSKESVEYPALYSDVNRFSEPNRCDEIDGLKYSFFNVAKRGNTYYNYKSDYSSRIYYIGQVLEDFNIYTKIPEYVAPTGMKFDRLPNTFYLLTNTMERNSDLLTINAYQKTYKSYLSSMPTMDKIGDDVVEKINKYSTIYHNKYDTFKLYLGEDLTSDNLIPEDEKSTTYNDLYINVESELGVENLEFYLLAGESITSRGNPVELDLKSIRGKSYIKITKELVADYLVQGKGVDSDENEYTYLSGYAILYVKLAENYTTSGNIKLTKFDLTLDISNSKYDLSDIQRYLYVLNSNGTKDYGFVDYHGRFDKNIMFYFRTDKIYEEDLEYKKSLFVTILAPNNLGVFTQEIINVQSSSAGTHESWVDLYDKPSDGVNGIQDKLVGILKPLTYKEAATGEYVTKRDSAYVIHSEVRFEPKIVNALELKFGQMTFPQSSQEGIYVTNDINFDSFEDFSLLTNLNKTQERVCSIGTQNDLYYIMASSEDMEFRITPYANGDYNIASDDYLYDIVGNKIMFFNAGQVFYVRVKYIKEPFYEVEGEYVYAVNA